MPRIPISQLDDEWDDEDLEHDHLGRPVTERKPKRPDHFNDDHSNSKRSKTNRNQEQK